MIEYVQKEGEQKIHGHIQFTNYLPYSEIEPLNEPELINLRKLQAEVTRLEGLISLATRYCWTLYAVNTPANNTYNTVLGTKWFDGALTREPTWNGGETTGLTRIAENITVRRFSVKLTTAPGVGTSRTYTLRQNGVDTAVTITISGTDTTGTWTGSQNLTQGSYIAIKHTLTGAPAATQTGIMTFWEVT